MRPSIAGLFDSHIQIWRPTITKDDIGAEERSYVQMALVGCAVNRSTAPEADQGPGLAPTGSIRWYGLASIDVRERDLCQIVDGPDAGRTWEVNEPPTRPRGHHVEVNCVEWNGKLPDEPLS